MARLVHRRRAMSLPRPIGASLLAFVAACGPSLGSDETGALGSTGSEHDDDDDDGGEASGSGTTDPFPMESCPCETIEPERSRCTDAPSEVSNAKRVPEVLAPIGDLFTGKIAVLGAEIYLERDLNEPVLQRFTEGDAEFADVLALAPGARVEALVPSDGELLVLTRGSDEDALSRWTETDGLQEVAAFGELRLGNGSATEGAQLVGGSGHALVVFPPQEQFPDAAHATRTVADVDLLTGTFALLPEPLAGPTPTTDGWIGLRPQLVEYQYCYDYSCIRTNVAATWSVVETGAAGPSVRSSEHCVENDMFDLPINHAWLHESSYVFSSTAALRSVSTSDEERDLWRGGGMIRDAVLHGDAVFASIYRDSTNELVRVPLAGGAPELWLTAPTDHSLVNFRVAGVIDDRLYVALPDGNDAWQLAALDL